MLCYSGLVPRGWPRACGSRLFIDVSKHLNPYIKKLFLLKVVECYGLKVCFPPKFYFEALTPNVMVFGDGDFERLSLDEIMSVESP